MPGADGGVSEFFVGEELDTAFVSARWCGEALMYVGCVLLVLDDLHPSHERSPYRGFCESHPMNI